MLTDMNQKLKKDRKKRTVGLILKLIVLFVTFQAIDPSKIHQQDLFNGIIILLTVICCVDKIIKDERARADYLEEELQKYYRDSLEKDLKGD